MISERSIYQRMFWCVYLTVRYFDPCDINKIHDSLWTYFGFTIDQEFASLSDFVLAACHLIATYCSIKVFSSIGQYHVSSDIWIMTPRRYSTLDQHLADNMCTWIFAPDSWIALQCWHSSQNFNRYFTWLLLHLYTVHSHWPWCEGPTGDKHQIFLLNKQQRHRHKPVKSLAWFRW